MRLFRLRYMVLPLAIFFLSLALFAYFYHLLPPEIAYHFKDGLPDRWLSRNITIVWMLVPQFFLVLLASAIVWGMTRLSARFQPPPSQRAEKLLWLMGNMVALPQIILGFAMLDIFSYNAYQVHLLPLWVFALMVMGLGGVILGFLFICAVRRSGVEAGQNP